MLEDNRIESSLVINKEILEKIISSLRNSTNKDDIGITSNILFEVKNNQLIMKSSDRNYLDIKISIKPNSLSGEFKPTTINGEIINQYVKALIYDGETFIKQVVEEENNDEEYEGDCYIYLMQGKKNKQQLKAYTTKESIDFEDCEDIKKGYKKIELDNVFLLDTFKNILHCCENESIKYPPTKATSGVFIEIKDGFLNLATTDSRRLAFIKKEYVGSEKVELECSIAKKSIAEILKIFGYGGLLKDIIDYEKSIKEDSENRENKKEYEIDKTEKKYDAEEIENFIDFEIYVKYSSQEENSVDIICFKSDNVELYAHTIGSKFPNYKDLINKKPAVKPVMLEKERLLGILKKISSIDENLKMTIRQNEITLNTGENNGSYVEITIDNINTNVDDEIEIGITTTHLLECLANTKAEYVKMYIEDSYKPVYFELDEYEEIIMPLML